jgi:hypothetical protein
MARFLDVTAFFIIALLAGLCTGNPIDNLESSSGLTDNAAAANLSSSSVIVTESTLQSPNTVTMSANDDERQSESPTTTTSELYLIDLNMLPPPIANIVKNLPGLQYGQAAISYMNRVSGGIIPNAQIIFDSTTAAADDEQQHDNNNLLESKPESDGLSRSSRSADAVEPRKVTLLAGKKLLKGVLLTKLAVPIALKAGKVATIAALLPLKLAAKGAIVGGLIAKPILLKTALVGKKLALVKAPLLAVGGLAAGGLVKAGLVKAAIIPKIAATKVVG